VEHEKGLPVIESFPSVAGRDQSLDVRGGPDLLIYKDEGFGIVIRNPLPHMTLVSPARDAQVPGVGSK